MLKRERSPRGKHSLKIHSVSHSVHMYCQSLVTWNLWFPYNKRQFSRLIDQTLRPPSQLPSGHQPSLSKYGDEFVQDSHLLPFSPDTYVRHLTHRYLIVFSLTTVSVAHHLFSVKCRKIRKSGHFPFHIPHSRRSSWTLCAIRAQWFSLLPILSGISE